MEEKEADDVILLQALDNGSILVVKRKLTNEFVINGRQHVIRERIRKFRKCRVSSESETKEVDNENTSYRKTYVTAGRKKVRKRYSNINPDVEFLENEGVSVKRSIYTKNCVSAKKRFVLNGQNSFIPNSLVLSKSLKKEV